MDSGAFIISPPDLPEALNRPRRKGREAMGLTAVILLWALLVLTMPTQNAPLAAELFSPVAVKSLGLAVIFAAASCVALIVHEMGHLAAAIVCRFEVLTISLGVFRFTRGQSGWRARVRTKRVFTGSVAAIPRTNEFWRRRMLTVVVAGPLATLAAAMLAADLIHFQDFSGELVLFFLKAFFQVSFLIFILGLIPNSSHSLVQNDARLLVTLWRDRAGANSIFLYHLVLQHQLSGFEPGEFPLWLVELMATFKGGPDFMALYACIVASWAFDRGDQETGDLWDTHALQLSSLANPATQNACLANSACFDLAFRKDVDAARAKLDRIKLATIASPALQHRVLAARSLVFGWVADSLAEVAASRSLLPAELFDRGFECFFLKRLHSAAVSWVVPVSLPAPTR